MKMKRSNIAFVGGVCTLVVGAIITVAWASHAPCPPNGSGMAGVNAWNQANCNTVAGCNTSTVATSCNHEFSIQLTNHSQNGSIHTFEYQVCRVGGKAALSHWEFALGQIYCLGEGATMCSLVSAVRLNGQATTWICGLDPTTQLVGVKVDLPPGGGGVGTCYTFAYDFDSSVLADGCTFRVDCVLASTKAGHQDIRNPKTPSPGYLCIAGPVCECCDIPEFCEVGSGCTPGYWKTDTPQANDYSHWPAQYAPGDALAGVFAIPGCVTDSAVHGGTLLSALNFTGGAGTNGGARILLRAAVAGLLNAQASANDPDCWDNNGVPYPRSVASIIADVNAALASCDRTVMILLGGAIDADNNLGCPQDAHGNCEK
jgi:hypothetical protein